jgi:hypothetical protein
MLYVLGKKNRFESIHETNDTSELRDNSKMQKPSTFEFESIEQLYGHYTSLQSDSRKEKQGNGVGSCISKPPQLNTLNSVTRKNHTKRVN